MSTGDGAIGAAYARAEEFLAALGMTGLDVTDIVITRLPDAGQRRQWAIAITAKEVTAGDAVQPACAQCGRTGNASRDFAGTSILYSWFYGGAERYICRGPCLEIADDLD